MAAFKFYHAALHRSKLKIQRGREKIAPSWLRCFIPLGGQDG